MKAAPISLEQARAAKSKAAAMLAGLPVVGVGITRIDSGYGVKVNLRETIPDEQMPAEVDGVPIKFEVVGEISKR